MFDRIQDLHMDIPDLGIDEYLSSYGISLVDLVVPTNSIEVPMSKIPGRIGSVHGRYEINNPEVELVIQLDGRNKLDLLDKEDTVRYLFSQPVYMTLTHRMSYEPLYKFRKIGDFPDGYNQTCNRYSIDVIPVGIMETSRDGLRVRYTISLEFKDVPYRYVSKRIVDLSDFIRGYQDKPYYEIYNDSNIIQDSRQFGIELRVKGITTTRFEVLTESFTSPVKNSHYIYMGTLVPNSELVFDGYMTTVDGVKQAQKTNYKPLMIYPGKSKMVFGTTNKSTPTGTLTFKEYIY